MRPPPDRSDLLTVRRARRSDLDTIDRIERQSFETDRFSRRNLRRALAGNRAQFLLADVNGAAAGYAMLILRKGAKAARLYSLAVDPAHREKGVAGALLSEAERLCRKMGADRLRLELRPSNMAAARLYERAGYALLERKTGYYDDGEDAIRLEKRLAPAASGDRSAHA